MEPTRRILGASQMEAIQECDETFDNLETITLNNSDSTVNCTRRADIPFSELLGSPLSPIRGTPVPIKRAQPSQPKTAAKTKEAAAATPSFKSGHKVREPTWTQEKQDAIERTKRPVKHATVIQPAMKSYMALVVSKSLDFDERMKIASSLLKKPAAYSAQARSAQP